MTFPGDRKGSRGIPSGRGNTQFRGRGGSVSRHGFGRANRGGGRGGRRPKFDSARVAEKEDREAEETSEEEDDSPEEGHSEVASEESEEEQEKPAHSYAELMQILRAETEPPAKKRKLNASESRKFQDSEKDFHEEGIDVDHVDEPEEGPATEIDALLEDEDETEDATDPFEAHFADEHSLASKLQSLQNNQWSIETSVIPTLGKVFRNLPGGSSRTTISEPTDLKLKQKLGKVFLKDKQNFNPIERIVADVIFNYEDLLFCARTPANAADLRRLSCLHAVNHIFKTRDRVIKNTARLAQSSDLECRDQGFTRPKVLMILPTRDSCVRMVNTITSLCVPEQEENRKRFEDSYLDKEEKFSGREPDDFKELFSGNQDDMFRLGMKFTRKTVKYFSQFYNSDMIFASPLGLRMAIGTPEEKKVDDDFLSSIELVLVDHGDALLMQNWEHVEFIFEHLNLQPKEAHDCDFSRVRSWYLDNNAKFFRQTITFAPFNTPELNTLLFNQSKNWAGKTKVSGIYPGVIQELGMKVRQTFSRLESPSFTTDPETRFTYFTSAIIPTLTRHSKERGVLLFIPSYYDFVRIRNYFASAAATSSLSFGSICEYTETRDVARARSHFLTGRHAILLYTERAHHFKRYRIRGVTKIVMYGLPDNPRFYKELIAENLGKSVQEGKLTAGAGSVRVVFSKWDVLKLERIVGTERVGKMIKEKGDTFHFL